MAVPDICEYGRCKIQFLPKKIAVAYRCLLRMLFSLVPSPCAPPGEKQSGEQSQIFLAYSPKVVVTNDIAKLVIIT